MASQRLTEEEVHIACAEIAAQGERPTSLNLLEKLGRGSLTTITKYLNSWNTTDEAQAIGVDSLPAIVQLPSELTKDGEDLLKKIWSIAKGIADAELDIQREALKQAEAANQTKVEEAFKFSEAQSMKIERLENVLTKIEHQLAESEEKYRKTITQFNEAEKVNVGLSKDNDQLKNEIRELNNQVATSKEEIRATTQEKQVLEEAHSNVLKKKDVEIKSLAMKNQKLQTSLDLAATSIDQLKTDIKNKASELSARIVELEKLRVHYETATEELNTTKKDLKVASKLAVDSGKLVAKLEGQLEVYNSLNKP